MHVSRILKVSLLIIIAVGVVGCSATPMRRSIKEGWHDSVVSTKVDYKLVADKLVKKRNIEVDTWRGVVTLTGRVASANEKERAEHLAWQVKGVRGVDNFLKVVGDAYVEPKEVVAGKGNKDVVTKSEKEDVASKQKVVQKESGPVKSEEPVVGSHEAKVNNKVEGPVVYDETKTKPEEKMTAKRKDYNKPETSQIQEEDLTSEESLAREAAEELKKLRGDE